MRSIWITAFAAAALTFAWAVYSPEGVQGGTKRPGGTVEAGTGKAGTGEVTIDISGRQARQPPQGTEKAPEDLPTPAQAVGRGIDWLVAAQGQDGGWGQDGGETSHVRQGENLETSGNDAANTAVAALALLRAGHTPTAGKHKSAVRRAADFVLKHVEASLANGLAVTTITGTQIQRKLDPYIDTFLTSRLLTELDGQMGDARANARVRRALEKCVAKIEANQQKDGSWNISGGWAPILGTSLASRSLFEAKARGVRVDEAVLARVDDYTKRSARPVELDGEAVAGALRGIAGGATLSGRSLTRSAPADAASAGVPLYKAAQALEQLSRTEEDRAANKHEIAAMTGALSDERFARGFGSMGGEEFFSYLNISDSLRRAGGKEWESWNGKIKNQLAGLQNQDGTWAGHHCITGRVAVTSAALLTLLADQEAAGSAAANPSEG